MLAVMLQLLLPLVLCSATLPASTPLVRVSHAALTQHALSATYPNVAAARDALRAVKASGGLPAGDITVTLDAGVHAPFVLDERDSGSELSRITYRSAVPGGAVISGGVGVPPTLCTERKATVGDPVVVCDLSSLHLNKTTTLGFRSLAVSFAGAPVSTRTVGLFLRFAGRP